LPRLKAGVVVQVHDIFIPDDYPEEWNEHLFNEQYVIAAMMMSGAPPFRILAPLAFIARTMRWGLELIGCFFPTVPSWISLGKRLAWIVILVRSDGVAAPDTLGAPGETPTFSGYVALATISSTSQEAHF
jgi:hypothetical protein